MARGVLEINSWLNQAVRTAEEEDSVNISIEERKAFRRVFGRTSNADDDVRTTIATFGSVATVNVNETLTSTNSIDSVASSDDGDTEVLTVEGHTIDTSTGDFTFVTQDVTLTGNTPASLTTPLARIERAFVKPGTFASPASDLAGDVYFYDDTANVGGVTLGVPQTSAAVHLRIVAGQNQSEKCAMTTQSTDYFFINQVHVCVNRDAANTVTADFDLEFKEKGGVWRPLGLELDVRTNAVQAFAIDFTPELIIRPNTDLRMIVISNTNDTVATGYMSGVFGKVL